MLTKGCKKQSCRHFCCEAINKAHSLAAFAREFIQAPSHVGSVCPSSQALTSAMINYLPDKSKGLIVDLGAGSGIVSEQLVRNGIDASRIVAVEVSPGFKNIFQKRCPNVSLVVGNARNLSSILDAYDLSAPISGIVSSLPLRMMSASLVTEIMLEVKNTIEQRGGLLIQYTYAWWMRYSLSKYGFVPVSNQFVLKNLPPAKVEAYVV